MLNETVHNLLYVLFILNINIHMWKSSKTLYWQITLADRINTYSYLGHYSNSPFLLFLMCDLHCLCWWIHLVRWIHQHMHCLRLFEKISTRVYWSVKPTKCMRCLNTIKLIGFMVCSPLLAWVSIIVLFTGTCNKQRFERVTLCPAISEMSYR